LATVRTDPSAPAAPPSCSGWITPPSNGADLTNTSYLRERDGSSGTNKKAADPGGVRGLALGQETSPTYGDTSVRTFLCSYRSRARSAPHAASGQTEPS